MTLATLTSNKDSWVSEGTADTNYGTATNFQLASQDPTRRRGFFGFDCSSIASGSTINNATFSLYHYLNVKTTSAIHRVSRITGSWTESGASGVTWNNQPGVTTDSQTTASISTATNEWKDFDIKNILQDAINLGATQIGLRTIDDDESTASPNRYYLGYCREYNGTDPKLVVDYSGAAGGSGTDSMGNYPDGLLYETGLSLSGNVTDIYAGEDDVVIPIVHRHETIHDAAKKYNEIYGLKSFIDPADDYYHLLSATVDFPTLSYTLSYGSDINSSNLSWDGRDKDHGVIVYGSPPFFYKTGSSPYTYLYDANITSLEIAKEKAKNWYNIHTRSKGIAQGSITVPAITHSLIGKKIVVEDDDRGWSGYGNVVGMNHTLRADRWTTEVLFENVPPDNAKTLAEVLEEIEKMEDEPTYMGVYDCFYPFDTSSTGLVSNSTTYASISAIGFGTSSANSASATPNGLIDIRQVENKNIDLYYFLIRSNWGNQLYGNTGSSALIKELCIFKNDNDDGHPYSASVLHTLSRPTAAFADASFSVDLATYTFDNMGFNIEAKGLSYRMKDGGNKMKIGWAPTASDSGGNPKDGILCPIIKSGSYWTLSSQYDPISASYHDSVSWDCYSKSDNYYGFLRTVSSETEQVVFQMTFKTGLSREEAADIDKIRVNAVARTDFYDTGSVHTNSIYIYVWDWVNGKYYGAQGDITAIGEWANVVYQMGTDNLISKYVNDNGIVHIAIAPGDDLLSNSTMSLDVAYVDFFVERGVPNLIIEKGRFLQHDDIKSYMYVNRPIKYLEGIYTTSDASGEEVIKSPIIVGHKASREPVLDEYIHPTMIRYKEDIPVFKSYPFTLDSAQVMGKPNAIWSGRWGEDSWDEIKSIRGMSKTHSLYVKYMPETQELGTQFYSDNFGFSRSSNGGAKDKIIWQVKSSSDDRMSQNFPAYALPYTIKFYHLGKDDSVGNPTATEGDVKYRLVPSIGIDKTREKTLTCAFEE